MTDVSFSAARPSLVVSDVERALMMYRNALGFDVVATMGEPVSFAIIAKDAASIALVQHDEVYDVGSAGVNIYIDVSDVEALYAQCQSAGLKISHELTTHPWGMKDFVIVDPDGHQIGFGERR